MYYSEGSETQTIRLDDYYGGGMGEYDDRVSDHRPVGLKLSLPEIFGIDDIEFTRANVYPNPATDKIYLTGLAEGYFEYMIYDTYGNELLSGIYAIGNAIDVSYLNPGLYFVNLIYGDKSQVFKLIKQ